MQPQGVFCWYFKVGRVNERLHILLKLLMTTFCSQDWLILLGRFVSEFIYISYLAMQATQVLCLLKSFTQYFAKSVQKNCTQKNFFFLISVWRLSPSSSWRENVSTKTSVGKGRVLPHHPPPSSTPQIPKCQSGLFFTQHQVWSWDGPSEANNY